MASTTLSTARPKRARNARTDGDQSGLARHATANGTPTANGSTVSAEQRHAMIAATAYRRAERRSFADGDPLADWLESEKEVDALLSHSAD